MKLLTILSILLLFSFTRREKMDPCLQEVDAIFKTMYGQLPQKGKVVYVNYEIATTSWATANEQEEVKRMEVKTYAAGAHYRFISDEMEVYQDENHVFTVIPARKAIYWAQAAIAGNGADRLKQTRQMQDTLFRNYRQVSCKASAVDGADKVVTLFPNQKWADLMQIESVDYYLNSSKKELKKQVIHYSRHKKLKTLEYRFREIDYDYRQVDLSKPVKSLFTDAQSKLLPPYTTYKLMDARKKKAGSNKQN